MNKKILLACFLLLFLVACSRQENEVAVRSSSTTEESSAISSSSIDQSTSTQLQAVTDPYQSVLDLYKENIGKSADELDTIGVSRRLSWLTDFPESYDGLLSSRYDINGDGREELLLAIRGKSRYFLLEVYGLSTAQEVGRLSLGMQEGGLSENGRLQLLLLQNGQLMVRYNILYFLYTISEDGITCEKAGDGSGESPTVEVDLTSLTWTMESPTTQTATATNEQSSTTVDIHAMANGDFSSIAGTWVNGEGNVKVIDAQGNITIPGVPEYAHAFRVNARTQGELENGYFIGSSDAPTVVVPKGVAFPQFVITDGQDLTDSSRDRMYGWQGPDYGARVAQNVYYRQE